MELGVLTSHRSRRASCIRILYARLYINILTQLSIFVKEISNAERM